MKHIYLSLVLAAISSSALAFPSNAVSRGPTLAGGQSINTNEFLVSPNGAFYLTSQADGNLCVRHAYDDRQIWCSRSTPAAGANFHTDMQTDGNLSTYGDRGGSWCLTDRPRDDGPFYVAMQNDANLCVYTGIYPHANGNAVWCTMATAQPYGTGLVYGGEYHVQNGYQGWSGGFLDTRGAGCDDNVLCVSSSYRRNRDTNSGTWVIVSANGRKFGEPVLSGDRVHLANKYPYNYSGDSALIPYKFGGYLDTRGRGCDDNFLCVSTSWKPNRDSGSGVWIIRSDIGKSGQIMQYQPTTLTNGYDLGNGGNLDTRGRGCDDNDLCVSTSRETNRDSGSGLWRLLAPF